MKVIVRRQRGENFLRKKNRVKGSTITTNKRREKSRRVLTTNVDYRGCKEKVKREFRTGLYANRGEKGVLTSSSGH